MKLKSPFLLMALALACGITSANATMVESSLHGCILGSGCIEANIGGVPVTPGYQTNFGFFASPGQSGDLVLKFLVPDSLTLAQVQAWAAHETITGTSTGPWWYS